VVDVLEAPFAEGAEVVPTSLLNCSLFIVMVSAFCERVK
jgi:hypothetical protein